MSYFFDFHTEVFETAEQRRFVVENKSRDQRQTMIEHLVFRYPKFDEIVHNLAKFHNPVEGGHAQCGYAGGLIGDSRSGKTAILSALSKMPEHKPVHLADGTIHYPMAYIPGRADMNRADLVGEIFEATEATSVPRLTREAAKKLGAWRVQMSGVKLLVVDDAHFIFQSRRDMREGVLDILKNLLDRRLCNILLVGMDDIDSGLMQFVQLYRRGHFPAQRIDAFDESVTAKVDYNGFLKVVSKMLPFEMESRLEQQAYFGAFLEQTGGLRGATMDIVIDAGCYALDDRATHVSGRHLYQACFKRAKPRQKSIPFEGLN